MQSSIDKTSPLPLYVQVADWLENMIKGKGYQIGTKLPFEGELAQKFQLNRNTIRQAISLLVQKGFVEKQKGVGTFVKRKDSPLPIHKLSRMVSFVDDFDLDNIELEDRIILKKKIIEAPYEICIERAKYYTESYQETEGLHPAIRAAKALEKTI